MPRALEERPELTASMEQYAQAFAILNYFRNDRGGLNFSDIVKYAEAIDEANIIDFVSIVTKVDREFLKAVRENKDLTGITKDG